MTVVVVVQLEAVVSGAQTSLAARLRYSNLHADKTRHLLEQSSRTDLSCPVLSRSRLVATSILAKYL